MNQIIITGNLGQDAQEKTFAGGQKYWVLNIATTEKWKNKEGEKKEKTTWHRCQLSGNYDGLIPYLRQGKQVLVKGLQRHESYNFKDTTNQEEVLFNNKPIKMSMAFIRVESIELLGNKSSESAQAAPQSTAAAPATATAKTDDAPPPNQEDDLPF